MGSEFAQFIEWNYNQGLDWQLLDYEMHRKFQHFIKELNKYYLKEEALWSLDYSWEGFQWIEPHNSSQSIIIFIRKSGKDKTPLLAIFNFTPTAYKKYRIGVPELGEYEEVFNTDKETFGGSDQLNREKSLATKLPWHNFPYSIDITIPPLGAIYINKINGNILKNRK